MQCPKCNATVNDGALFCEYCGSSLAPDAQNPVGSDAYQQPSYEQPPAQGTASAAPSQPYAPAGFSEQGYNNQNYQQPGQTGYQQPAYASMEGVVPPGSKSKVAAGLLAILLGSLGIHKFYLGYTKAGLIMLLVSLLTFGIGLTVMAIIGLVEGILYLVKSDWDFYQTYELGEKQWF